MSHIYVFYPDVFLLNNFVVHTSIILLVNKLCRLEITKRIIVRMILFSLLISLILTACVLRVANYIIYIFANFILGGILIAICLVGIKDVRLWLKVFFYTIFVSSLLGGCTNAIQNLFASGDKIIIMGLGIISSSYMVISMTHICRMQKYVLEVELVHNERKYRCTAFLDSGNRLMLQEKGVHIVAESLCEELGMVERKCTMHYKALGNEAGAIEVYRADLLSTYINNKKYVEHAVLLAKAPDSLFEGKKYKIILNGDLLCF